MLTVWLALVGSFVGTAAALAIAGWIAWRIRDGALATIDLIEHTAKQVTTLHDQLTAPNSAADTPTPPTPSTPVTPLPKKGK